MEVCGFSRGDSMSIKCAELGQDTCDGRCWQHCSWALAQNAKMFALCGKRLSEWQMREQYRSLLDEWETHGIECHGIPDNREKKTPNGKYNGPFAFTLTMSPTDGLTESDMILACRKILDQKSQPVKKFAWYLEYKEEETKSHPHIHGMYETENGRRIEKKHWVRQWKIWDENIPLGKGFRGGYHRPVRKDEAYSKYIAKQDGVGDKHI